MGRACPYSDAVRRSLLLLVCLLAWPPAADAAKPKPKPRPKPATLHLSAPAATYGERVVLRGRMIPPARNARVRISLAGRVFTHARVGRRGGFHVTVRARTRGPYRAGFFKVVSKPLYLRVRPRLHASLVGQRMVGGRLAVYAQLRPPRAGTIRVEVLRSGKRTFSGSYRRHLRLRLGTTRFGDVRVRLRVIPRRGFAAAKPVVLAAKLVPPVLRYGDSGPAVTELVRRLAALRYAVARTSAATFGSDVLDSVYAFQKVHWLRRDGVVGPRFWRTLERAKVPRPRGGSGDRLEVDKSRQVLFVVRGGEVVSIVPVSTGGGYWTPEGYFSVQRKIPGFDPSPLGTLYLPMYFIGGYAIHGNPSVPPYPASHGCIRVPMWMAGRLYETNGYGATVFVYS